VRAWRVTLVVGAMALCAGCSAASPSGSGAPDTPDTSLTTTVESVSSTSQLSDMVKWNATNKSGQPQLATCEVLVLKGHTQLGDDGPLQLAVAGGATAQEFSEVTTLAGSHPGDTAQIVCQKGLAAAGP
jgi:hypothetical protein